MILILRRGRKRVRNSMLRAFDTRTYVIRDLRLQYFYKITVVGLLQVHTFLWNLLLSSYPTGKMTRRISTKECHQRQKDSRDIECDCRSEYTDPWLTSEEGSSMALFCLTARNLWMMFLTFTPLIDNWRTDLQNSSFDYDNMCRKVNPIPREDTTTCWVKWKTPFTQGNTSWDSFDNTSWMKYSIW